MDDFRLVPQEEDLAKLDAIFVQHGITPEAKAAISEWAKTFGRNVSYRCMGSFVDAHQKQHDDWKERYDRLNEVLGSCTVKFLRNGLNAIEPRRSRLWNTALSDELMRAADTIITGKDQELKAKLIAACRS